MARRAKAPLSHLGRLPLKDFMQPRSITTASLYDVRHHRDFCHPDTRGRPHPHLPQCNARIICPVKRRGAKPSQIRAPFFLGCRIWATLRFTLSNWYHWIPDDEGLSTGYTNRTMKLSFRLKGNFHPIWRVFAVPVTSFARTLQS